MIEYIRGTVAELTPTTVTLETSNGIGYQLNISLATFSSLEGVAETRLLVHEAIKEDTWTLYGFIDDKERNLFRLLISVSGVGASTARMILSSISAPELEQVIASGDPARLKTVKGVGAKTAQRIIVDLKDKVNAPDDLLSTVTATVDSATFEEALAALVMLGFQRQQSHKVLKKLFDSNPSITVEAAIKRALTMM